MKVKCIFLVILFIIGSIRGIATDDEEMPHLEIKNWALKFGVNLWAFGQHLTNINEIERRYRRHDIHVTRKDSLTVIREFTFELQNLMDMKTEAAARIMDTAEQSALSNPEGVKNYDEPSSYQVKKCRNLVPVTNGYKPKTENEIYFQENSHFGNYEVGVSHSCYLSSTKDSSTPENRNNMEKDTTWLDFMDSLYPDNYIEDPTLGWQYFGTTKGLLQLYPALKLSEDGKSTATDVDNFRLKPWFVGAATSAKDIVIILDTSPGFSKKNRKLAYMTMKTIMETLGSNDFVNILTVDEMQPYLIPCTRDTLVQATDQNKYKLISEGRISKTQNPPNMTISLTTAFNLLENFRKVKEHGSQCNSAIMLITDSVDSTFDAIFKKFNHPHPTIRMFTYSISNSDGISDELKTIACLNKGYYEHIKDLKEIQEKVLSYVWVMARPHALYTNERLVRWTPMYLKEKGETEEDYDGVSSVLPVMTVSVAAYDLRNTTANRGNLLGVAAADVFLHEMMKYLPRYKLGVNGYWFLVDNNGHVAYHPSIRFRYPGMEKDYLESVDISDLEKMDLRHSWDNNTTLFRMREKLIRQIEGEAKLRVRALLDNLKRATFRHNRYYYTPILDTPYSVAVVLPDHYGMFEIKADLEVKRSEEEVLTYFNGTEWKVHPDWVYCEYNFPSYMQFRTPEEQLMYFVRKAVRPGWQWMSLRPRSLIRSPTKERRKFLRKLSESSHYCDKDLVQSLFFDAMITHEFGKTTSLVDTYKHDSHPLATLMALLRSHGYYHFGESMAFVATRSGLLRWHNLRSPNDTQYIPHTQFTDHNSRSIDELWYKRAVDQYVIEKESFVYSLPFDGATVPGTNKQLITASHAIFVDYKGYSTPVAVVGVQYQYDILASHFFNISTTCTGGVCKKRCDKEDLECYILDDHGYVLISEKQPEAGKFFGEIDGTIMDSLVQDGIYRKVMMEDTQETCPVEPEAQYDAASRLIPLENIFKASSWIFGKILWIFSQLTVWKSDDNYVLANDHDVFIEYNRNGEEEIEEEPLLKAEDDILYDENTNSSDPTTTDIPHPTVPVYVPSKPRGGNKHRKPKEDKKMRKCTKKASLFVLESNRLSNDGHSTPLKGKLTNCHSTGCEKPFSVQKIPHSNLILLVINNLCPCGNKVLTTRPEVLAEDSECPIKASKLYRGKGLKCQHYHAEEKDINRCGSGSKILVLDVVLIGSILLSMFLI